MSHIASLRLRASGVFGALALTSVAGVIIAEPSEAATANRVMRMTFDDAVFDSKPIRFVNSGTASLSISVASLYGGTIRQGVGRGSSATALSARMPSFHAAPDGPRAVIRVVDRLGADNLNPRAGAFTFGADFVRDAKSEQAGSSDNGDNLMQRGLFGNSTQYKIQLDHGQVSCRIKGAGGIVAVVSPVSISSGRWYRVRCNRTGSAVTLTVIRWAASGAAISKSTVRTGRTGSLTPAVSSVPLSIGGKLNAAGAVVPATDQFNGRIDNPILALG